MANFDLLNRVLDTVTDNPEWKQAVYRCETGMCFAGWTAALTGAQWAEPELDESEESYLGPDRYNLVVHPVTGEELQVSVYAREVLGLDYFEGCELFKGSNRIEDLRRIVAQYAPPVTDADVSELLPAQELVEA